MARFRRKGRGRSRGGFGLGGIKNILKLVAIGAGAGVIANTVAPQTGRVGGGVAGLMLGGVPAGLAGLAAPEILGMISQISGGIKTSTAW